MERTTEVMPVFNATTKSSESVWKSPDGQREIFSVKLDVGGKEFEAKTYSRDISQAGFTGEVESYEKPGQNGKPAQTFVKQAQKEFKGGGSKPYTRPTQDQFTMYLSYAKDLAVAMLKDGKLDESEYAKVLDAVSSGGHTLYEARPGAVNVQSKNVDAQELDVVVDPDAEILNELFPGE